MLPLQGIVVDCNEDPPGYLSENELLIQFFTDFRGITNGKYFFSPCVYLAWDWLCEDLKAEMIKVLFLVITRGPTREVAFNQQKKPLIITGSLNLFGKFSGHNNKNVKKKLINFWGHLMVIEINHMQSWKKYFGTRYLEKTLPKV